MFHENLTHLWIITDWLLKPDMSNPPCMCMYASMLGLDSFPPQTLHHKKRGSCYQMVKQTHRPTAHNSNPLSTLLSTCLSLVPYLYSLWPMQRKEKEEVGRNKNNAEIMGIS